MFNITQQDHHILITINHRKLIKFPIQNSLELGIGQDQYVMKHGAFKFKEKVTKFTYHFLNFDQDKNTLVFNNLNHKVKIKFVEIENHLALHFSYTDKRVNRVYLNFMTSEDEKIYGCGEQFAALNLKNKKVKIWVSEHIPLSSLLKKAVAYTFDQTIKTMAFEKYASYMVQPTFISNHKLFVHLDSDSYSQFEFGEKEIQIEVREAIKTIHIGVSRDYEDMMIELTSIIGRQPRLPDWVFDGMILGIQDGSQVCHDKTMTMINHGAKINGIWAQDWEGQRITAFGKQLFWDWKYDKQLYEHLPSYIKKWQKENVKLLGYINPFLALEGDLYKEASKHGYLVKNNKGDDYLVTITTFPAAMIDLTNPDAYEFMKNVIKDNMIKIGMKGWMADFAEYLPTDAVLFNGEDPRLVHNTWPVRWAKLNEEAISESGLSDDILFFVRAGYTGTSQHAKVMWNGDQHVDWSRDFGIGSIVNSQLSLGLSGIGNSHSDIGGYTTFAKMVRSKELFLRWMEMNTFSMMMRSHEGNQPDKNHQFDTDEETIAFVSRFTQIYAHMKTYLKEVDKVNHLTGMPSVRPLFFYYDYPEFLELDQVYLLGRDVLVYPVVTKGQTEMTINLPDDEWIHMFTGKEYQGQLTIDCPIGTPVVFYRKHSDYKHIFETIKDI